MGIVLNKTAKVIEDAFNTTMLRNGFDPTINQTFIDKLLPYIRQNTDRRYKKAHIFEYDKERCFLKVTYLFYYVQFNWNDSRFHITNILTEEKLKKHFKVY